MPNKDIQNFLDAINDAHLKNFQDKEYTIHEDKALGFRLVHQGTNKDPKEKNHPHRIYMQPIKGGKSTYSKKMASNAVLARCHAGDKATPAEVRTALIASNNNWGKSKQPPLYYAPEEVMDEFAAIG